MSFLPFVAALPAIIDLFRGDDSSNDEADRYRQLQEEANRRAAERDAQIQNLQNQMHEQNRARDAERRADEQARVQREERMLRQHQEEMRRQREEEERRRQQQQQQMAGLQQEMNRREKKFSEKIAANTEKHLEQVRQMKSEHERKHQEVVQATERAEERVRNAQDEIARQAREFEQRHEQVRQQLNAAIEQRKQENAEFQQQMLRAQQEHEREREEHRAEMTEFKKTALESEHRNLQERKADLEREQRRLGRQFDSAREELEEVVLQLSDERAKVMHFEREHQDPSIKSVVLLGLTGDGKSTLANRLIGDTSEEATEGAFGTSGGVESETQVILKVLARFHGQKLAVVDTPGIEDSSGRDREHINNLVSYLKGCAGVNQFLLVKAISNPRLSMTYQNMLTRLEQILGSEFWSFTTIVLTGVEGRYVRKLEQHQRELSEFLHRQYGCGSLNAIGIGFDDYEEVIRDLVVNGIPNRKFQSENLVSPIDELEKKIEELTPGVDELVQEMEELNLKREHVALQIEDVRNQLRNLSG